jgi:hypothetical protein
MERKHGTLTLLVMPEGAAKFGTLQTIAYDDATPKTYRKARKEIEARRDGWSWNYPAYRGAKFEIVDTELGAAEAKPATERGDKATRADFQHELNAISLHHSAAVKRMTALQGKRGFGEWKRFVGEIERERRELIARFPQFASGV